MILIVAMSLTVASAAPFLTPTCTCIVNIPLPSPSFLFRLLLPTHLPTSPSPSLPVTPLPPPPSTSLPSLPITPSRMLEQHCPHTRGTWNERLKVFLANTFNFLRRTTPRQKIILCEMMMFTLIVIDLCV